jgi:signal transduction histidine kinase
MMPRWALDAYGGDMSVFGWMRRTAGRHPYGADLALAAMVSSVMLLGAAPDGPGVAVIPVTGLAGGALVFRRRRPFTALGLATAGAVAYSAVTGAHGVALAAPLIALYNAADLTGRRRALTAGWLAVFTLAVTHVAIRGNPWAGWENVALIALGGLAVAAGDAARNRRKYVAEVEERARRAEHERDQEARRQVTEERLRIARDLHDVVGHHLALINVQAGVATHVLADRPDQALEALAHIRRTCRAGLDELRDTIGLLREPGEPAVPTEPAAGLAGLADLVASFARSGLRVDHDVAGAARPLPPAVDLTAYRVIQESLTNVRKHAGDVSTARLRLTYERAAVRILVEDDGNAPAPGGGGHGIAGMRERVAAIGGSLEAGPRPGPGFRVSARLPLAEGGGRS